MKKRNRIIAIFLVWCFILNLTPTYIVQAAPKNKPKEESKQRQAPKKNEKSKIEKEVDEKKERQVKHFKKSDNTYEAVIYSYPIHFKQGATWKNINNSLEAGTQEDKDFAKGGYLGNNDNDFKVKFADSPDEKTLVKVSKDDYEISWSLVEDSSQKNKKTKAETKPKPGKASVDKSIKDKNKKDIEDIVKKKLEKENFDSDTEKEEATNILINNEILKQAEESISKISYPDIVTDVDLQYTLVGNEVKEDIIIKTPSDNIEFKFNLNIKNLNLILNKDKSISLFDKKNSKKEVMRIASPYMRDGNNEVSKVVDVKLTTQNGGYELDIKPDNQWINDPKRAFPIIIDPVVQTSLDPNQIQDTFVASAMPNEVKYYADRLGVGKGTASGVTRSYLKFTLPEIKSTDLVIDGYLQLARYTLNNANRQINAHKVLSPWSSTTTTWNNAPSFSQKVEDYQIINTDISEWYNFDITSIAKEWYTTGNNNGIMLKNEDETVGYNDFLSSDCDSSYAYARPKVILTYVNNSGLEDYWTYHSGSALRAGTFYINDYNGNTILDHTDLSMNGNIMPVTIKHIFNSNEKDINLGYGKGWRLNFTQLAQGPFTDLVSQYYTYTDEDGTIHYFRYNQSNNRWEDQSGLNITIYRGADNNLIVKDKKDNQLKFLTNGKLGSIVDQNSNTIILSYDGADRLSTITDGATRVIKLAYDGTGKLNNIEDPSGRKITYGYSGDTLSTITYPDGKVSTYTYDGRSLISNMKNFDGIQLNVNYYDASPYRFKSMAQSNVDGTIGGSLSYDYGNNITNITDAKGRKESYIFNNQGNTTSIKNADNLAEHYKFITDKTSVNVNKLTLNSKLQGFTENYILNHNFENTNYYGYGDDGGSTSTYGYTTEDKYLGYSSFKITKTNTATRSYLQQFVTLEKGKTYTYSAYIKTKDIATSNNQGAHLLVHYQNNQGVWQEKTSYYVKGTNDWGRYDVTFTIPSDAASNQVIARIAIGGATGTACFDSLQLENGEIANRYSLVENSTFRANNGIIPDMWTGYSLDGNDKLGTVDSALAFSIGGKATLTKNLGQNIKVSGKKDDVFILSGFGKAESVQIGNTPRRFALDMAIHKTDGTYQFKQVSFNTSSGEWQYTSDIIIAEADYTEVFVYGIYNFNANTAYFKNISLYKEEFGTSYSYDANGNIVSVAEIDKKNESFEYSAKNDLISQIDPKGNKFTYVYDDKHNITKATSSENVVYSFTYDEHGNPLTSKVGEGTTYISGSSSYTSDYNYMSTLTDSEDNVVNYSYNTVKGVLDSTTDPKGKVTSYIYEPDTDRLKTVTKNVDGSDVSNSYTYTNDRITAINHNNFNYNFTYDSLGNNTKVSVGTQALITNEFDLKSGVINKSTYGNNQNISFIYDTLDRVKEKQFNGATRFSYFYDSAGNLGALKDSVNNINYKYIYDLADRLIKIKESNGNEATYNYDNNNNVSKVNERIPSLSTNQLSTSYAVDKDNRETETTVNSGGKSKTTYDALGRVTVKAISNGTADIWSTNYSYKAGTQGRTTTKVESINNKGNMIQYTYDKVGNIETITQDGKTIKYYYNELNELIREDNKVLYKTITYSYDMGGNLLNKAEYPYTTDATLGTEVKTVPYVYGDANWKDKLTSYDGKTITSDAIGNITSYNGNTYTWEEGRKLKSISGSGSNITYTYNDAGIRTSKTVNGVTANYHLLGDKVTYESNGTDKIYYSYNMSNDLVAMNLNGTEYYYIRNAQGDIIGLIDGNGTQVVSYVYDSWGKLISVDGTLKDSVGVKNPYRYRGYRYDTETQLYYLQSRYYNPEFSRFINADSEGGAVGNLLSHNVFTYCSNNPVAREDSSGNAWWIVGAVVGAVVGGLVGAAYSYYKTGAVDWRYVAGGAVAGALVGVGLGYAAETAYAAITASGAVATKVADKFRFSQTTASPNFSEEGKFAGKTIGQVSQQLRSGVLKAKDVPVEYIKRGETNLIINTRSSLALKRANIPIEKWNLINRTGNLNYESHINERLIRNGLTNTGTDVIRITGVGQGASSLK